MLIRTYPLMRYIIEAKNMVKTLLSSGIQIFILILLFSLQNSFSQSTFTFGVKGGVIYSQYIITGVGYAGHGTGFRTGPAIGVTAKLISSKHFMFMSEIYYLQRGMSYAKNEYPFAGNSGKTSVHFLSFNFLPAYRIESKFIFPYIFAGLRIEQALNYDNGGLPYFYSLTEKTNIGLAAGIGFEKAISNSTNITAEFRYDRDFIGFKSDAANIGGALNKYINSSFDFLIGLNFNLGKNKNYNLYDNR